MVNVQKISKKYEDYVLEVRRHLHRHPELSWEEDETLRYIRGEIEKAPFEYEMHIAKGGIWVDVTVDPKKERILLRADVDALPIEEGTNLPFTSENPGVMHACGHDCHAAMLLGAFRALEEFKPSVNIRFVWQRAEEVCHILSGGESLVQEGVCEGISKVFALHVGANLTPGIFSTNPGKLLAQSDHLKFEIGCSGGHVKDPERGDNAIDIMTDIHVALRGLDTRFLGPQEAISFTPAISNAGSVHNIFPGKGSATYSLRNYLTKEKRDAFAHHIKERIEGIVKLYPTAFLKEFHLFPGHPTLINTPEIVKESRVILDEEFTTEYCAPSLAGEDFAYYLQERQGAYWILGAHQGEGHGHHTSRFNPNESVLWKGVAFWLLLLERLPQAQVMLEIRKDPHEVLL